MDQKYEGLPHVSKSRSKSVYALAATASMVRSASVLSMQVKTATGQAYRGCHGIPSAANTA